MEKGAFINDVMHKGVGGLLRNNCKRECHKGLKFCMKMISIIIYLCAFLFILGKLWKKDILLGK